MRSAIDDLETAIASDQFESKEAEWGEMHVAVQTFHVEMDTTPLLQGLPDDRCQCPHWGYLLEGQIQVDYPDRSETINAGDVYYLEPGHRVTNTAGTRVVEFSPKDTHRETIEVMMQNFERMQQEL